MLISTVIMGWIGILIYGSIITTYKKMAKNNEYAFIHLLMALMYAMWLPLPIMLYQVLDSKILLAGTIFGMIYLVMIVITMTLQTGHISYLLKLNRDNAITDDQGNYMMATLSNPFEQLANIFRCIWALFLGITFFSNGEIFMAYFMFIFVVLIVYYFCMMVDRSLIKRVKIFSWAKPNFIVVNLETFLFFVILMCYITLIL